jgi:hypothetical protein
VRKHDARLAGQRAQSGFVNVPIHVRLENRAGQRPLPRRVLVRTLDEQHAKLVLDYVNSATSTDTIDATPEEHQAQADKIAEAMLYNLNHAEPTATLRAPQDPERHGRAYASAR